MSIEKKSLLGKNEVKRAIEVGEEKLYAPQSFANVAGKKKYYAGVDGGSTQFRVTLIAEDELEEFDKHLSVQYIVPSRSVQMNDDRKIESKTALLYDNMDSTLINTSGSNEVLVQNVRTLRGTKADDSNIKAKRLVSKQQKTAEQLFYININESIGYALLQKCGDSVPSEVEIVLGLSLPPDDRSEKSMQRLRDNLQKYKWKHNTSGVSVNINYLEIDTMTEPEAAVKGYYAVNDEDTPEYVLHFEAGGRSTGVEILVNGLSLDSAQKTLTFGGTQLQDSLSTLFVNKYGGSGLVPETAQVALRTGLVRNGNHKTDVMDLVDEAKRQLGVRMVDETRERVFDTQDVVDITEINVVSMSGRTFGHTILPEDWIKEAGEGNAPALVKTSITDHLAKEFAKHAPNVEFNYIEENYIPTGLMLNLLTNYWPEDEGESEFVGVEDTTEAVDESPEIQLDTAPSEGPIN